MSLDFALIRIMTFMKRGIIEMTEELEHTIQLACRGGVRVDAIVVRFDAHRYCVLLTWGNGQRNAHLPDYRPLLLRFLQNGYRQGFSLVCLIRRRSECSTEIADELP